MKNTNELIFIAGFPRSGTTWFSNLLNSHSKVIYRHEIIGRNYKLFSDELFHALKNNHGLDDEQHQQAMQIIAKADVNTDKPPFFKKDKGMLGHPKIHYFSWMAAKTVPILAKIYDMIFKVPKSAGWKLLIKETRSTNALDSILKGLRAQHILYLVRLPYGTIASHIKGESIGSMEKQTSQTKAAWFKFICTHPYSKKIGLTEDYVQAMSSAEYYAIKWRIYHEDLVAFNETLPNAIFCFYDDFVSQPIKETKLLFDAISLKYNNDVENFIEESTGIISSPTLLKDSNNDYFSVYRKASHDNEAWMKELNEADIHMIDKHTKDFYHMLRCTFRTGTL